MPAVPKPTSKTKEKKKYSSLQQKTPLKAKHKVCKNAHSKKKDGSVNEFKKQVIPQHNHRPTRKDRAEFPPDVVKELIENADGRCQCGCGRSDNETHHVMPRTRDGRGVKTNGMRVNTICNQRFHANEEELQYWIKEYEKKYGPYFWFDDLDWENHHNKIRQQKIRDEKEKELEKSYKPISRMLEEVSGRKVTVAEKRVLRKIAVDKNDIEVLVRLMKDIYVS